ncbi:MAG: hypothetical protein KAU89_01435 [Candidatus Thorarchaeota archaeon]|nr:hypothetical protein [Candidatus Thorarchaeota archaeon]
MLKKILQLIVNDGLLYKREMAERIGVQTETLDDMLKILLERGYLRLSECGVSEKVVCSSCPSAGSCNTEVSGQAYYVTPRGRMYAEH